MQRYWKKSRMCLKGEGHLCLCFFIILNIIQDQCNWIIVIMLFVSFLVFLCSFFLFYFFFISSFLSFLFPSFPSLFSSLSLLHSDFLAQPRGCPLPAVTFLPEVRSVLLVTDAARASATRPKATSPWAKVGLTSEHEHTDTQVFVLC